MKKSTTRFLLIVSVALSCLSGCHKEKHDFIKGNYFRDSSLTSIDGRSKKGCDSTLYFPWLIGSGYDRNDKDNFYSGQYEYSTILCAFGEPVLYNYYLGHDIYRFMYVHSFYLPVLIRLEDFRDSITMNIRQIDQYCNLESPRNALPEKPAYIYFVGDDGKSTDSINIYDNPGDTIVKARIIYNKTRKIDRQHFQHLLSILEDIEFWNLEPWLCGAQVDGASCLLEVHTRHGYWFINRCATDQEIIELKDYFIKTANIPYEVSHRIIPFEY